MSKRPNPQINTEVTPSKSPQSPQSPQTPQSPEYEKLQLEELIDRFVQLSKKSKEIKDDNVRLQAENERLQEELNKPRIPSTPNKVYIEEVERLKKELHEAKNGKDLAERDLRNLKQEAEEAKKKWQKLDKDLEEAKKVHIDDIQKVEHLAQDLDFEKKASEEKERNLKNLVVSLQLDLEDHKKLLKAETQKGLDLIEAIVRKDSEKENALLEAKKLEKTNDELAQKIANLPILEAENRSLKETTAAAKNKAGAQEEEIKRLKEEIESLKKELSQKDEKIAQFNKKVTQLNEEVAQLNKENRSGFAVISKEIEIFKELIEEEEKRLEVASPPEKKRKLDPEYSPTQKPKEAPKTQAAKPQGAEAGAASMFKFGSKPQLRISSFESRTLTLVLHNSTETFIPLSGYEIVAGAAEKTQSIFTFSSGAQILPNTEYRVDLSRERGKVEKILVPGCTLKLLDKSRGIVHQFKI